MNQCNFMGRISTDIDYKDYGDGKTRAFFMLAVKRVAVQNKVDFIPCEAWRKTADIVNKYCFKGKPVGIAGELHLNPYVDQYGTKQVKFKINIEKITFSGDDDKAAQTQSQSRPNNSHEDYAAPYVDDFSGDQPF